MPKTNKLSPAARELRGALTIYLAPRLAADAKLPNFADILLGAPATNRITQTTAIAAALRAATAGKLAKDADIEDVVDVIEAAERVIDEARQADGEDDMATEPNAAMPMAEADEDEDEEVDDDEARDEHPLLAKVREFCKGKMSEADCAKLDEMMGEELKAGATDMIPGEDEEDDKMPKNAIRKEAMDAAIAAAITANDAKHSAIAAARDKVRRSPVGEIRAACDSAAAVFRKALETKGVATKDVPDAGMEALFDAYAALPTPAARRANDAAIPAGVPAPEDFYAVRAA